MLTCTCFETRFVLLLPLITSTRSHLRIGSEEPKRPNKCEQTLYFIVVELAAKVMFNYLMMA